MATKPSVIFLIKILIHTCLLKHLFLDFDKQCPRLSRKIHGWQKMHSSKPSVMWKLLNIQNVCPAKISCAFYGSIDHILTEISSSSFSLSYSFTEKETARDSWQEHGSYQTEAQPLQLVVCRWRLLNDLYSFISYFRSPYALICLWHWGFLFVCDKKYTRSPRKIHRWHNIRVANLWSSESNVYSTGGVSTISCALYRSIFSDLSLLAALDYRVRC